MRELGSHYQDIDGWESEHEQWVGYYHGLLEVGNHHGLEEQSPYKLSSSLAYLLSVE